MRSERDTCLLWAELEVSSGETKWKGPKWKGHCLSGTWFLPLVHGTCCQGQTQSQPSGLALFSILKRSISDPLPHPVYFSRDLFKHHPPQTSVLGPLTVYSSNGRPPAGRPAAPARITAEPSFCTCLQPEKGKTGRWGNRITANEIKIIRGKDFLSRKVSIQLALITTLHNLFTLACQNVAKVKPVGECEALWPWHRVL